MEIIGKIIIALPEQSGTSKSGNNWRKREYVLETQEQYPKKVFFNLFGDNVGKYPMNVGDNVRIFFDLNSREFNGRWYTDVTVWKVDKPADFSQMSQPAPAPTYTPEPPRMQPTPAPAINYDDDKLPF